jgi:hypothetical protein
MLLSDPARAPTGRDERDRKEAPKVNTGEAIEGPEKIRQTCDIRQIARKL